MKKLIITIIATFTLGAFNSNAQDIQFAHVRSLDVLDSIQSYKELVNKLEEIQKDAQDMYASLEKKYYAMQPTPEAIDTLNDLEIQILKTDMEKIQYDIQQLDMITQQRQQVLQQRMQKLMEMFQEAVKIVAEKNSILYVLDADNQLLYASPKGKDITEQVLIEMLRMDKETPAHRNSWGG